MEGYLRGYYGYKNFGDELLFFGVIRRLFSKYPLTKLFIEVGNKEWMEDRVWENYQGLLTEKQLNALKFVDAQQHSYKWITHLMNILGFGKYRHLFKFFGGGEVLSDERSFPHDGRNLFFLFHQTIRDRKFVLLGGIGEPHKKLTNILYHYLLPKAEKIVVRDKDSFTIATSLNTETVLYQDFAQEIILQYQQIKEKKLVSYTQPYILININKQMINKEHIRKIVDFCQQYVHHRKIFFPCDMNDDNYCADVIKHYIPNLETYDWTQHSVQESLSLFYHADGGVGARLHFLLPLKLYNKPLVAIPYADKINKLIIKQ